MPTSTQYSLEPKFFAGEQRVSNPPLIRKFRARFGSQDRTDPEQQRMDQN